MGRIRPIRVDRRGDARRAPRLLNLGVKSLARLADIGIQDRDQIRALGPIEVCRRLRAAGHPASLLMAYALEGALTDTHWQDLPGETKRFLREAFAQLRQPPRVRVRPSDRPAGA